MMSLFGFGPWEHLRYCFFREEVTTNARERRGYFVKRNWLVLYKYRTPVWIINSKENGSRTKRKWWCAMRERWDFCSMAKTDRILQQESIQEQETRTERTTLSADQCTLAARLCRWSRFTWQERLMLCGIVQYWCKKGSCNLPLFSSLLSYPT